MMATNSILAVIMFMQSISDPTRRIVARFAGDRRGNVAVIFAVALVPLLGFVGAAVDYSRANATRSSMQVAMDSAALMVSKDLSADPTLSAAQISAKATAYFNALYTRADAGTITLTANYTTNTQNGSTVTLAGTGSVTTNFMKMVGYPKLGIGTTSTTTWGSTRMRVAMALDVTGSMASSNKMSNMQSAAKNLIDTLQATARTAEDVYISIIPFAQMVNVGNSNKSASWIKWSDWEAANGNNVCQSTDRKGNCTSYAWVPANHNTWNGCVTDRDQPYDTTSDNPTSDSTKYPANQYNACPAQILPMTSAYSSTNIATLKAKIDDLSPNGGTNQAIGLAWAWETLQTGDPLASPTKDTNYKYTDALIILSDGLNTVDRWYGNGHDTSPQVDARQKLLCDNIKASSTSTNPIVIYTIQVNTDGDAESAILKYCANSGNFFSTTTASGIQAAFTAIGNSLNQLRVARSPRRRSNPKRKTPGHQAGRFDVNRLRG
jgi:Flp pilus assembly protein TadG